jgi:hypothetical protein
MNAFRTTATSPNPSSPSKNAIAVTLPVRHVHRERDFGVGYGNSSGYASTRRYVDSRSQPRFRCV